MIDFMPDEDSFDSNEESSNDNEDDEHENSEDWNSKQNATSLGLKYWTVRRCSAYVLERISGKIKLNIYTMSSYFWG